MGVLGVETIAQMVKGLWVLGFGVCGVKGLGSACEGV